MNSTIIGEAVNLARRLEDLNKFFLTRIIISEDTFRRVKDDFVARKLDRVAVILARRIWHRTRPPVRILVMEA